MHSYQHTDVVIASGQTVQTDSIDLQGWLLCGLIVPAEFDGTAITFQASDQDGATFLPVYDATGTAVGLTTAASRHVVISPTTFAGARRVKVVAGTAQTGATTLVAVLHAES